MIAATGVAAAIFVAERRAGRLIDVGPAQEPVAETSSATVPSLR